MTVNIYGRFAAGDAGLPQVVLEAHLELIVDIVKYRVLMIWEGGEALATWIHLKKGSLAIVHILNTLRNYVNLIWK